MAIDRRVTRTRTALYEALLALIRRTHYDLISVEDILCEANVGRSTFYAHFTSKDDLLESSLERLRALLVSVRDESAAAAPPGGTSRWDPCRALFEHVSEFSDIQLALVGGRGASIVRDAVDDVLANLLRESLPGQEAGQPPRELAIRHIVSTFNTLLRWWQESRPEMAPTEADALFRTLVRYGLPPGSCEPFIATGIRAKGRFR